MIKIFREEGVRKINVADCKCDRFYTESDLTTDDTYLYYHKMTVNNFEKDDHGHYYFLKFNTNTRFPFVITIHPEEYFYECTDNNKFIISDDYD